MDAQLKKGLLDYCVLAALKKGESYGYRIVQDLAPRFVLSESTLYPILRRLEKKGDILCRAEAHNGRLRRYYSLTEQGISRLEDFSETVIFLQNITEYITSGGTK